MNTYRIPVVWQVWGVYEVEAENQDAAVEKVMDQDYPLPDGSDYLDDSIEVDFPGIEKIRP